MKQVRKLFLAAAFVFGAVYGTQAQTDTAATGGNYFYYYPESNLYVSQSGTDFYYYDSTASNWATAKKLPANYKISKNAPKNMVYYKGTDVWLDNTWHKRRYGKKDAVPQN